MKVTPRIPSCSLRYHDLEYFQYINPFHTLSKAPPYHQLGYHSWKPWILYVSYEFESWVSHSTGHWLRMPAMQLKGVELLQDLHNCCRIPPPNALIDLLEFTFACSTLQLNSFTNIQMCIQHPIGSPPSAGGWKPLIHHTLVCGCLMCRAFIPSLHKKSTCSSALTLQVKLQWEKCQKVF